MGKSKHSKKWYDDAIDVHDRKQQDWDKRREEKRLAWEQKQSALKFAPKPDDYEDSD